MRPQGRLSVTVVGWVLKESESGKAVAFLWEHRRHSHEVIYLPKSQIQVKDCEWHDEVTMPEWLAERNGLT